jgi:hypothetical protein
LNQTLTRYAIHPDGYAPARPNGLFVKGGDGTAYLTLAAICLAALVYAFVADLLGEFGETARILAIVLTGVLTMTGAAICLLRGYLAAFFVSIAGLFSIFLFLFIFSVNSGVPFTLTSGGEYIGLTFTGLFFLTLKDRSYGRLMTWFYYVCVGYAFYYIAASIALRLGLIDVGGVVRAVASADDAGRSDRLHSAALLMIYGTCYSVVMMRKGFTIWYLLASLLFSFAWYITQSRTITLVVVLAVLPYVVIGRADLLKKVAMVVFYLGVVGSLLIISDPSLNPFLYFGDQSASVRTNSIQIVSDSIQYYWSQGAGISFGVENYKPLTGITYFFPGDIGLIGILYTYGIAGFGLYILLCHLGINANRTLIRAGYNEKLGDICLLSGVIIAIYSLQSPQYNGGSSGSIFASMLVALFIYSRSAKVPMQGSHRELKPVPAPGG